MFKRIHICFLGVLSEWREMPVGQLERAMGIHAGRDSDHTRRGVQGEEGARNLTCARLHGVACWLSCSSTQVESPVLCRTSQIKREVVVVGESSEGGTPVSRLYGKWVKSNQRGRSEGCVHTILC